MPRPGALHAMPKEKKKAAPEVTAAAPAAPTYVPEGDLGIVCVFDEAVAMGIDYGLNSDELYEDPEGEFAPQPLEAAACSWRRPADFLQPLCAEGAWPCIVQMTDTAEEARSPMVQPDTVPTLANRVVPNPIRPGIAMPDAKGTASEAAARALEWITSCMQAQVDR